MPTVPKSLTFRTPPGELKAELLLFCYWKGLLLRVTLSQLRELMQEYPRRDTIPNSLIWQEWDRRTLLRPAMPTAITAKPTELLRAV